MTIANHDRRRAIRLGIFVTVVILALIWLGASAQALKVRSEEETARILALEKVTVRDGVVSGEVRNKANHPVRDVQLFVRYTWLWDDERNPGNIDPGTSTYYALQETIQSGEKIDFNHNGGGNDACERWSTTRHAVRYDRHGVDTGDNLAWDVGASAKSSLRRRNRAHFSA